MPLKSGEVSKWAIKPTAGTGQATLPGQVPITQPCSLSDTRSKPSAIISCCNARASFNCPSVLGTCFTFALDWVSKET
ncbi:Uncharacterised protein [Serratia marcescens]|nr:Uncharacterised protein [Serratia marcescens]CUY71994.1 Uncharacterised protein [Serratia marcescens]CVC52382.1 Uncharacterised protein [Serratia marcescens]CVC55059.1 Uncharacterised protein [Serratia marcescens]CVC86734.1 Uncharacterised protein [Serratia marcescens]